MICQVKIGLYVLAALLFLVGAVLTYRSFKHGEGVLAAGLGVFFLLASSNIVIYFYSIQPVPQRIIEELGEEELPDLGLSEGTSSYLIGKENVAINEIQ